MSQGRAYQLLRAARVVECTTVHSLQGTSQVPESEAIARELVPLLRNPQALDEAWNEAVAGANGGVPTAAAVHEIVVRKLAEPQPEKKPLHDLEGIDPSLFKLATRAIALVNNFSQFVETAKLLCLYQGGAHTALGYTSWAIAVPARLLCSFRVS
jgi:hypothetical protein